MVVRNLLHLADDSRASPSVSAALASMVATGRSVEVAFSHILAFHPDWTYLGIDVGVGLSPAFGLRERDRLPARLHQSRIWYNKMR